MRVQGKIGGRVADLVLRVFGVVPAEEGPGPLAPVAVDVLDPRRARLFGQEVMPGLSVFRVNDVVSP